MYPQTYEFQYTHNKIATRNCKALLDKEHVRLEIDNKEVYDIDFKDIKSYTFQSIESLRLVIETDKEKISMPVNINFIDSKKTLRFFNAFDAAIKEYVKDHPHSIVRKKPFFISEQGTMLLIFFTALVIGMMIYGTSHNKMSGTKELMFSLAIGILWFVHAKERKNYFAQTPTEMQEKTTTGERNGS